MSFACACFDVAACVGESEVAAVFGVVEVQAGSDGAEWFVASDARVCWLVAGGEGSAGLAVLCSVPLGVAGGVAFDEREPVGSAFG